MNPGIGVRVVGFLAAVTVLAACSPVSSPSTTAPSTTPPASTAPPITEIPAAAFLQTEDLGDGGYFVTEGIPGDLLSPCRGAALKSDSMQVVRKEIVGTYRYVARYDTINKQKVPDGTVNEVITSYRAGGASAYLKEVREQVARCATETLNEEFIDAVVVVTIERTVVAENIAGDESLIWRLKRSGTYYGRYNETNDLAAVIRLGDVIVFVQIGTSPGLPLRDPIDRLSAAATRRATAHLTP